LLQTAVRSSWDETQSADLSLGTLAGVVISGKGAPVADATVTIQTAEGSHPHATRSDAQGHFAFTRFTPGQYDVRAYSNGLWSEWQRRVNIKRGKRTEVTLRLETDK
jgi:protocatechuate 3,4-dioxygenase beta subunit